MTLRFRYKVGDVIQFKNTTIRKKIIEVGDTGYTFQDTSNQEIRISEESADPFLEDGWRLID